jgi:D-alanyl-D-alanine carboxypeptidase
MAVLLAALLFFSAASSGWARGETDIDPAFALSKSELESAASRLPPAVKERILENPKGFLELLAKTLEEPQDLLTLVDKAHALPSDSAPPDLVPLSGYSLSVTKKGLSLRRILLPDLLDMAKTAKTQGITLPLSSTYRSYEYQVELYQSALKTQTREQVERELAPPGHSQHQLGTVIDFGSIDAAFAKTAAGMWLFVNAWRFGFTLSYPEGKEEETGYSSEPWHYRYVGKSAAAIIHRYFADSQQEFLVFYEESHGFFEGKRR